MDDKEHKNHIDVVALPGDGIGPEVMEQGLAVLDLVSQSCGVEIRVDSIPCGGAFFLEHGSRDWPEGSEKKCEAADLILLGAVGHPDKRTAAPVMMPDGRMAGWSPVIGNRVKLGLFANVRPVRLLPGVLHELSGRHAPVWAPSDVDMVFVRENTEDLYVGIGGILESRGEEQLAVDTRIVTREASERVVRFAFELARERAQVDKPDGQERSVTCILKDNLLRGCQLFGKVFRAVGEEYPEIEKKHAIVDAFAQGLISHPERYDVCVTTNMFGDILTDLASVLQGGMGLAVGCNIGDRHGMFEPIHGSAPDLAGKDLANPMAMILAIREGLRWVSKRQAIEALSMASDLIEEAICAVLRRGTPLTFDLVGSSQAAPMSAVGDAIARELKSRLDNTSFD